MGEDVLSGACDYWKFFEHHFLLPINDRLLAPWTHPHPSSDKSQELKAAWAENKDCQEIPLFEFSESLSENIPKLSIYDDIESVKAKAHLLFMHLDIFSTHNGVTKKDT